MAFVKTREIIPEENTDRYLAGTRETESFLICKSPEKISALINSIKPGLQVHYVCNGDWSHHSLVMELIKLLKPAEVFLTTYALREFPVRQLILSQEKKEIISLNVVLDYRAKARTPEVFQLISNNSTKIFLTNVHAKVTVIRSESQSICIVGSANWTQNPRIEAGVISCNQDLCNFHIDWINKTMENAELFR